MMDSQEPTVVDSRSSSAARERPHNGPTPQDNTVEIMSDSPSSKGRSKRKRRPGKPDVRELVQSGGLSSSAHVPPQGGESDGSPECAEDVEEGEIDEDPGPSPGQIPTPILALPFTGQPVSGRAPRVKWNSAANTKIRTKLGDLSQKANLPKQSSDNSRDVSPLRESSVRGPTTGEQPEPDEAGAKVKSASASELQASLANDPSQPALEAHDSRTTVPGPPSPRDAGKATDVDPFSGSSIESKQERNAKADGIPDVNLADQKGRPDNQQTSGPILTRNHRPSIKNHPPVSGQPGRTSSNIEVVIETDSAARARFSKDVGEDRVGQDDLASPVSEPSVPSPQDDHSRDPSYGKDGTTDSDGDSMIHDYSRSDRVTRSRDRRAHKANVLPQQETESWDPPHPKYMADLSALDRDLQRRYTMPSSLSTATVLPGRSRGEAVSDEAPLVMCLICGLDGHGQATCPTLRCHDCNAYNEHSSHACPTTSKCTVCHKQGHRRVDCSAKKIEVSDGPREKCDICREPGHFDIRCPKVWRTYSADSARLRKVCRLPMACYSCGASDHFGTECRLRAYEKHRFFSGGTTFRFENFQKYLDPKSSNFPIALPEREFSIRRKARVSPAFYAESDSDDDPRNFIKERVNKDVGPRKHMKFGGVGFSQAPGRTENMPPGRSRNRSLEDHYRAPSPRGSSSHRGRGARQPSPPNAPPRRFDDRLSRRDTRFPESRRDGEDRDSYRWAPPLPREPLPPRPPPASRGPRSGQRGGRGGGGRGQGRGGNSSGDRGSTYTPMPSAAKNAWKKHRI